jgi:DNA-binding HxlR family transcriptional regulator
MSDRHQLGDATLDLVTDECTLAILSELSGGAVRASDIEARAPGVAHWTTLRRLQSLARSRFVSAVNEAGTLPREHDRPAPPRARYALTKLGREFLLEVPAAAARCEQAWCSPPPEQRGAPGLWVLGLVADRRTRALARALADAPLRSADLQVRLPDLGRSALLRRLRTLPACGVLVREEHAGEVRYALTDGARHLVIVPLRAARCEWQRATPQDRVLSGDLPGLLHVLAPLGRIPQGLNGTCRWHLDSNASLQADIYLAVASGKIAVLNAAPMTVPQAVSHATPQVWCEALLRSDPSTIATTGDHVLLNAVFSGLSSALLE